jgi:hypothetical protein
VSVSELINKQALTADFLDNVSEAEEAIRRIREIASETDNVNVAALNELERKLRIVAEKAEEVLAGKSEFDDYAVTVLKEYGEECFAEAAIAEQTLAAGAKRKGK